MSDQWGGNFPLTHPPVRQATLRLRSEQTFLKSARSGAHPVVSVKVKRQARVLLLRQSGPPAKVFHVEHFVGVFLYV